MRDDNIRGEENTEARRNIKRKPKKIQKFFSKLYEQYIKREIKYNDVKFDYVQFKKYVKIVSNN